MKKTWFTRSSSLLGAGAVACALLFAGCEPAGTDFAVDSTADVGDAIAARVVPA